MDLRAKSKAESDRLMEHCMKLREESQSLIVELRKLSEESRQLRSYSKSVLSTIEGIQ